ncbi:MAG: S1 RNA-binding domain-containing protein, partial [Pseudomonadota bacterium]|nr:S1 RNA-binding domain-containing protein [Pseudomonadota bacterium]
VVPGFIRKSALSRDRSEQRPDRFAAGEKVDAKITQVDKSGRRLTLSIRAHEVEEEKQAMATYGSSDSGASLGDILGAAIQEKQEATKRGGAEKQAKTASAPEPESEEISAKKKTKKAEDVAEKKTAAKKPAQKAHDKAKNVIKKKPSVKKTATKKADDAKGETKKKPAVKKTAAKKAGDAKSETKKKSAVKKTAAKDDK